MSDKLDIVVLWLLLGAVVFLAGFQFGRGRAADPDRVIVLTDTLTVRDTVTETEYKDRFVYLRQADTVWLETAGNSDLSDHSADDAQNPAKETPDSSVLVQVPIDYIREDYDGASVWYHGFRAGIDSLRTYRDTVFVNRTEIRTVTPSRWGISLQAGYGAGKSGLSPYIGVGLSYNILNLGRR